MKHPRPEFTLLVAGSLAGFLLALSGCCGTAAQTEVEAPRAPEEQQAAAVQLVVSCKTAPDVMEMGMGSGVLVADRLVLTAAHVVACEGTVSIQVTVMATGQELTATAETIDTNSDIARLTLSEPVAATPMTYGPRPELDDRVCLVSAVPEYTRRCGNVQSFREGKGDVWHDAITQPGNSGGGVYDSRGRLVGIVTHYYTCRNGQFCGGAFSSFNGRSWVLR